MRSPDASGTSLPGGRRPDVTARRRVIVSDIRHDLKNSHLAAVCSLQQLDELPHDGPLKDVLAGLKAALGEIMTHAERSLELLALGVDDIEPSTEPLALEPILREVELARRAGAEKAGIDLRALPTGAVAAVDHRLLTRCIGNLVTNAIEHSGGNRVVVGVRRRGSGCMIEVRDNGRGIDPEALRGLDGRRWVEGSGRGLGLWIAGRFAALLGGEVDVRAEAGRGSCFRVTLPGPVSWAPGSPRTARPLRLRLDGRLVVLLDDDASLLEAVRLAFQRRGAMVIVARSQVEFWNEIEQLPQPPDLCVLDFILGRTGLLAKDSPDATSANDIAWVKKRFGERTKAVVLTAQPGHPQLAAVGNVPIFEKPLSDETMDEIVTLLQTAPRAQEH